MSQSGIKLLEDGKVMLATRTYGRVPGPVWHWMASEKLDGWRAIWTGTRMVSRRGNDLQAPLWFTRDLPRDVALDGELWCGRGGLAKVQSMDWTLRRFHVFDAPLAGGTFVHRLDVARQAVRVCAHAEAVPHWISQDPQADMERIVAMGGEGLILRHAFSDYEHARSCRFLKLKPRGVD